MAATAATRSAPRPAAAGAYDRIFYSGMAIVMALTVFVGFAPSYYSSAPSASSALQAFAPRRRSPPARQ